MEKVFTIDRFEGNYAVLEKNIDDFINIDRSLLPLDAKEGDIIGIYIKADETQIVKDRIEKKMNDLFI